jgi:hypothetical protein
MRLHQGQRLANHNNRAASRALDKIAVHQDRPSIDAWLDRGRRRTPAWANYDLYARAHS